MNEADNLSLFRIRKRALQGALRHFSVGASATEMLNDTPIAIVIRDGKFAVPNLPRSLCFRIED
jgi:hypothetical protein